MKKPILATNVGGVPESCINNKTCFLIEKNDPQGWIDKISVLLEDKEKMMCMGEEGFEYINNNFLWSKIAGKFIKILESKKI
jgi:glycosyltransferase involved in cell wall biosynthesis